MGQDNRESWLNRMATGMAPFFEALDAPLAAAGPLPHARLDTGGETTWPKKQAARLLKCECEACGAIRCEPRANGLRRSARRFAPSSIMG